MGRFVIRGGKTLCGEVTVSGSKNAALPIIFASLITHGVSEIYNLPDISDVRCALDIIKEFGAEVSICEGVAYINTANLEYRRPSDGKVSELRASTYLLGACLARFGRAELQSFGGCNFSKRPIDMHIAAATSFGARESCDALISGALSAAYISFAKKSVGATVNALIMAAAAEGESRIYGYAEEPHILTLIEYLRSAGACIERSDGCLSVLGGKLHGGRITIPGDMIEAGTFLAASLVTGGNVRVCGFDPAELSSFISPLVSAGVSSDIGSDNISLKGTPTCRMSIETSAYPGFPTDLQPIFAVIMARFFGGNIKETVWQGRFGYLSELAKQGIRYSISDRGARIYPSVFVPSIARSTDLRGGAAAVLTALCAEGESCVESGELILRGYERPDDKLRKIGADVVYLT